MTDILRTILEVVLYAGVLLVGAPMAVYFFRNYSQYWRIFVLGELDRK